MDLLAGEGIMITACILGVTHGVEPDHVAGITALTHEAGNPRLSALVGGCFGLGHTLLVVGWIALAYLLFESASFPPQFEQLGLLSVGIVLTLLSLSLGIRGTQSLLHKHDHSHDDGSHTHFHEHVSSLVSREDDHTNASKGTHEHGHGVFEYLTIGTIGALFTLSPPMSMIAFITLAMKNSGETLVLGVVAGYTVSIVATMAAIGGGAGSFFRVSKLKGKRFHAIAQVVAAVMVLVFAVNLLAGVVPDLLV